jgi:hypothetical protein
MIKWLHLNNWTYYFTICVIYIVLAYLMNSFLLTEDLFYANLGEQYTIDQIKQLLSLNKSWESIAYLFIPVVVIFRIFWTSFCLYIGDLVEESHWKFKPLFNISLKADIVFCLNSACNFFYYALTENYKTIEDLSINSSSLLKIVGKENIPSWLILAFNSVNAFELLYMVLLVILLKISFRITYFKSIVFVLLTYGVGNYLYLTAMTFLYLNFS